MRKTIVKIAVMLAIISALLLSAAYAQEVSLPLAQQNLFGDKQAADQALRHQWDSTLIYLRSLSTVVEWWQQCGKETWCLDWLKTGLIPEESKATK